MSKTPEELALEWWAEYSKDRDLNKWDTVDPTVGFVAGYQAALEQVSGISKIVENMVDELVEKAVDVFFTVDLGNKNGKNT
jgi:hypothetical protein